MNLRCKLRHASGVTDTFEWNSETGELGGTVARQLAITIGEVLAEGVAGWGPQYCLAYPVRDPLHTPVETAVVLAMTSYYLPPELAAIYPEPPAELLADPDDADPNDPRVTY